MKIHRKYRCMKCSFRWEGWRVLWHECMSTGPHPCIQPCHLKGTCTKLKDKPLRGGMTECPKKECRSIYVEWVNARQILALLGRYWER